MDLELKAHGEVLRPERDAGGNQSWRTSQDFLQSWKVPSEKVGRMVWSRGKNPEARLYCRVLSNGVLQTIIESKINRARRVL